MGLKKSKLIGDRKFYGVLLAIVLPIIAQNGITQFVGLLDNIMVGQTGTEAMSGVAIVNQIIFVFNLVLFGGLSGAGIFTAQYYGSNDQEGIRRTVRFKIMTAVLICGAFVAIAFFFGDALISRFIHEGESEGDPALVLASGISYLRMLLWSLPFFTVTQVYASTLRETGKTLPPMLAGIAAVLVNLFFNYLLIFGKWGFPKMGVEGAALATGISRVVEMAIVLVWAHTHRQKNPYLHGLYRSLYVGGALTKQIFIKGMPLMVNEFFWSLGMTVMAQRLSMRGIDAVAAYNISSTVSNLFNIVFISMGNAIAIILGQLLGAGKIGQAKEDAKKLQFAAVVSSAVMAGLMIAFSGLFPLFYDTTETVRHTASALIIVAACVMPISAYNNACYFTIRSGGKTLITFLFDCCFVWVVTVPAATLLVRKTDWPVVWVYAGCMALEVLKSVAGTILVRSGKWAQNLALASTEKAAKNTDV